MNVRLLEVAQRELDEAIVEALAAIERIRRFPDGWHPMGPDLRRCLLRRFPYGLIYGKEDADIVLVAVAHTRRRPEYWRGRIRRRA